MSLSLLVLPTPPASQAGAGQPQPLWLQLFSAFQGSDADKSEDNLVVDEVSALGGWEGAGGLSQLAVAGLSLCSCLHCCS